MSREMYSSVHISQKAVIFTCTRYCSLRVRDHVLRNENTWQRSCFAGLSSAWWKVLGLIIIIIAATTTTTAAAAAATHFKWVCTL